MLAVRYRRIDCIDFMISNSADLNLQNNYGDTALMLALGTFSPNEDYYIYQGMIELLLIRDNASNSLNLRNNTGETALTLVNDQLQWLEHNLIGLSDAKKAETISHIQTIKRMIEEKINNS